ncbi:WXG100 family type VII secretion target [Labedaea rhizosphaerae]|uniref:Uncharacterized protein n=1 Tax=Labedaea rhizosphaerae TaxID=598644 RepID=A0A4R6SA91_LABRH|nr:hypothetical protein [Labedaea rhizosphaerae]TDP96413.1 hypothetical protein EV186_104400 [Labedaea rhizosphaerae]
MDAWDVPGGVPDGLLDGTDPGERPAPRRRAALGERHPYQSDVDYLRDVGERLELEGSTGEPTSKPVLDAGRFGLEFFHRFGRAYAEVTGTRADVTALARRYDAHRELNYARLRQDVERHRQVATTLDERILDFRNGASPVFEAWQGGAAEQAKSRFDAFLTRSEGVRDQFADLAGVLAVAVDTADRAVYEQAVGVADLWTDRVGTLTAADVEFAIDFARRCAAPEPGPLILDDEIRRVAGFCGIEVNPILCRLNQQTFRVLGEDVWSWLETVFVPFYRARADAVTAVCAATDTVIGGAWQALTAMLAEVDGAPFHGLFTEEPAAPSTVPVTAPIPVVAPVSEPPTDRFPVQQLAVQQPTEEPAEEPEIVIADDRPVPQTRADQPGGISSALG